MTRRRRHPRAAAFLALSAVALTAPDGRAADPAPPAIISSTIISPAGAPPAAQATGNAGTAQAMLAEAERRRRLGRLRPAADAFQTALNEAEAAGDVETARRALGALGMLRLRLGDWAAAEQDLQRFADQAAAAGDHADAAAALTGLGVLHGTRKRFDLAEAAFDAALAAADRGADPTIGATAALNAARAARDAGRRESAARRLRDAERRVRQTAAQRPADGETATALVALARLLEPATDGDGRADSAQAAYRLLAQAAAVAERAGDARAASFAWGHMGALYERTGQTDAAAEVVARAEAAAVAAQAPDSLYLWRRQTGRLAAARGDLDAAVAAFESAAAALDSVRGELAADPLTGPDNFTRNVEPLFLDYADALLQLADRRPEQARELTFRARAVMERLKAAELEDYLKDDCTAELEARKRTIDQIAPGTAVVYPISFHNRTELLVGTAGGLTRVAAPVGRRELTAAARDFRALLEKRSTHQYLDGARRLYDRLIRPIAPILEAAGVDTLVVVPDGPLRSIPFAALHDGERFLLERYAVSAAPGLTLIDPHPLSSTGGKALLAGLSAGVPGYAPLPQVDGELSALARMLDADVLRNEDFSRAALTRALLHGGHHIVHIASHGEFLGDHAQSRLLTHDGAVSFETLEKLLAAGRFRSRPLEMLVLSACRTAAGDDRAALGLAGVALKAGARSVVAGLWRIDDEASAQLMQAFYRRLQDKTTSKAEALRRAQLDLGRQARWRHPYYWGAFIIVGNWL